MNKPVKPTRSVPALVSADGPIDPPDDQQTEAGRKLFAQDCQFVMGATSTGAMPLDKQPEVAFAGRSNVGKSTLVNALTGRKTLARTSGTPGRTREINFFTLGDQLRLVDLPGYGYAKVSKSAVAEWTELTNDYLKGRANLQRLCLLIDSRHGIKDNDRDVMAMLDIAAVSYLVVLTKADKVRKSDLETRQREVAAEAAKHVAAHPYIVTTSGEKMLGIAELRAILAELAAPAGEQTPSTTPNIER